MKSEVSQIYEVYQVHNLPMPLHHVSAESNNCLVKYNLGTEMLMASEDRTKFSLLSESTYQMCNSYHYPETAFYQTSIKKCCVMALFMRNQCDIKILYKESVV